MLSIWTQLERIFMIPPAAPPPLRRGATAVLGSPQVEQVAWVGGSLKKYLSYSVNVLKKHNDFRSHR